jgi:hypothetical protein
MLTDLPSATGSKHSANEPNRGLAKSITPLSALAKAKWWQAVTALPFRSKEAAAL